MPHRWKPNVTVAALIERDGRFLLVEEETTDGLKLNNPAGHLDPGESPIQACAREVLEETAHDFEPTALIGVYLNRFTKTRTGDDITYMRFAFAGSLGTHHDWRPLDGRPVATSLPLPHYWEHVCWAWGAQDIDALLDMAGKVSLGRVLPRIRVPFLLTQREGDAEFESVVSSHITCDKLTNSPKPQMRVFAERDGSDECSDAGYNFNAGHYIADWVAETLGGRTAHVRPGHRHRLPKRP